MRRTVVEDAVAGSGAEPVRDHDRAGRHEGLLQVVERHLPAEGGEELPDALRGRRILDQRHAEDARQHLAGEIVRRRADAPRRDDDVGELKGMLPGPGEAVGVVTHREHGGHVDAEGEEPIGDPARVRVDDAAGGELVAGRQDRRALDHVSTRRNRVRSPA